MIWRLCFQIDDFRSVQNHSVGTETPKLIRTRRYYWPQKQSNTNEMSIKRRRGFNKRQRTIDRRYFFFIQIIKWRFVSFNWVPKTITYIQQLSVFTLRLAYITLHNH